MRFADAKNVHHLLAELFPLFLYGLLFFPNSFVERADESILRECSGVRYQYDRYAMQPGNNYHEICSRVKLLHKSSISWFMEQLMILLISSTDDFNLYAASLLLSIFPEGVMSISIAKFCISPSEFSPFNFFPLKV